MEPERLDRLVIPERLALRVQALLALLVQQDQQEQLGRLVSRALQVQAPLARQEQLGPQG